MARFGRKWPDLATFVAECGQFSGQFTAIRAMKVNDSQECKVIEFQRFVTHSHSQLLTLNGSFEGQFRLKDPKIWPVWPEIVQTPTGMSEKYGFNFNQPAQWQAMKSRNSMRSCGKPAPGPENLSLDDTSRTVASLR